MCGKKCLLMVSSASYNKMKRLEMFMLRTPIRISSPENDLYI